MSKDNLILFPNNRKAYMSMTNAEAKWMISGSLVVVLCIALGVNSSLFSKNTSQRAVAGEAGLHSSRSIASINPIFRVSWEKKTFEVLEKTKQRQLANVGQAPSIFEEFKFGELEGSYDIRRVDGKISEIQLSSQEDAKAKVLAKPENFLRSHLSLFSPQAHKLKQIHIENNDHQTIQKYSLIGDEGQDLGLIQMLLDNQQKLLSVTVQ